MQTDSGIGGSFGEPLVHGHFRARKNAGNTVNEALTKADAALYNAINRIERSGLRPGVKP